MASLLSTPQAAVRPAGACDVHETDKVRVGRARQGLVGGDAALTLAETFRVLGDPTRVRILDALGTPDVLGRFQSQGRNLIGVLDANANWSDSSNDLFGSPPSPLDPRLKPLGWYGGPTQTHALQRNSPALNAGDNTDAPSTDQRGRHRIMGGTIDIGSYEAAFGGGDTDRSQADNWWQPSSSATIDAIVGAGSTASSPTGAANVSSSSNPVTQRASRRVGAGTRPSGFQSLFEADDEWLTGGN